MKPPGQDRLSGYAGGQLLKGQTMLLRLGREEEGQTLVEYGLLAALLAIVSIAILTVLGRRVKDTYTTVNSGMVTSSV